MPKPGAAVDATVPAPANAASLHPPGRGGRARPGALCAARSGGAGLVTVTGMLRMREAAAGAICAA